MYLHLVADDLILYNYCNCILSRKKWERFMSQSISDIPIPILSIRKLVKYISMNDIFECKKQDTLSIWS